MCGGDRLEFRSTDPNSTAPGPVCKQWASRKIKAKLGKVLAPMSRWPAQQPAEVKVGEVLALLISLGASGNTPEPYFAFSWAKMAA